MLGEWWIADPADDGDDYKPPERSGRVPGLLQEVAQGEFALETIGFLDEHIRSSAGNSDSDELSGRTHVWGADRGRSCYSLLDCIKINSTMRFPSIAGGHQDWKVGWLAEGNAWVTPDDESPLTLLRTEALQPWALYGRDDDAISVDANRTATVDLQEETLGTANIDDIDISLIRRPNRSQQHAWETQDSYFTIDNIVSWKLEGPLTLQAIAQEWAGCVESFVRFMTLTPSVISGVTCHLCDTARSPLNVELTLRRLPREVGRNRASIPPDEFLTTWNSLAAHGVDPIEIVKSFVVKVSNGDLFTAMALHLDSQDRLLSRGTDGALLNGVRSVEAQFEYENPEVDESRVGVQTKIDSAADRAGQVGVRIRESWPALGELKELRIQAAHGKSRPSADFGLRCLGGAWSLQWIQRFHLLHALGTDEITAEAIVCENPRFERDLGSLEMWSSEL